MNNWKELSEEEYKNSVDNAYNNLYKHYHKESVEDSSHQQSQRFNTGKPQCNEIDPEFILGMGRVLTKSREKYDRANWTKSTPWRVPYDSAMRHLLAFQSGEDLDKESQESHLLHLAVNCMFLHYYYMTQPQNDDRIFKKSESDVKASNMGCDLPDSNKE